MANENMAQTVAAVKYCLVLLETLEELDGVAERSNMFLGSIPEGYAYTAYMGKMNLDQFFGLLSGLTKVGAITRRDNLISKGPEFASVIKAYKDLSNTWDKKMMGVK